VALETAAGSWRAMQLLAASSASTVDNAARQIVGTDWQSDAAEAYDTHRIKLTRDMAVLGEVAGETADALQSLAGTLRSAQAQLDTIFESLSGIPWVAGPNGTVTFTPADADQTLRLRQAATAAAPYRDLAEEELSIKGATLLSAMTELSGLEGRWKPQTVNIVNLNIGSGNDNNRLWGDKPGVEPDEVGELADLLASEDADIVTLQEVFHGDLEKLEHQLEERTGDNWEFSFAEGDSKVRFTGLGDLFDTGVNEPFGNAVFVREGGAIAGSEEVADHKLDRPGEWFEPPGETGPPTGTTTTTTPGTPTPAAPSPGIPDGEGRAAAHAQVTFNTPD
jgi:hypothetical protein